MSARVRSYPAVAVLAAAACGPTSIPPSQPAGAPVASAERDGSHDFDFEIGTWKTKLSRLVAPLSGSTEWVEYEGTTVVRKVWDGRANLVELVADGPAGHFEGLSLRLYNPQTRQWSLNFASSKGGELSPPAIGAFANGRGEFYSNETFDDRPILVRFVISEITETSCKFEQAFSADGGKTWEVNWIAHDTRIAPPSCCAVVELRQYTLQPGQRDTLIELFDREFIETQEATGMRVLGQFRDLDRPDRFVWLRGFADMPSRASALDAFYRGPTWKTFSKQANATMIDSDNVLLLRPARPSSGFALDGLNRDPSVAQSPQRVVAAIEHVDPAAAAEVAARLEREAAAAGATVLASFVTEASTNTFPALPVREGEHVVVVFAAFTEADAAHDRFVAALAKASVEVLELTPTTRSLVGRRSR
jgi:hypothetical protein